VLGATACVLLAAPNAFSQPYDSRLSQVDSVIQKAIDDHEIPGAVLLIGHDGQVVEHLPGPTLAQSLALAAAKLRAGGVLIAETINPLSPIALRNYFADLTHAQPLVPETLELLARQAGFAETEIRFLNEPAERLTEPDDPVIAANVRRLNELLFAPLDYALVARTAANA